MKNSLIYGIVVVFLLVIYFSPIDKATSSLNTNSLSALKDSTGINYKNFSDGSIGINGNKMFMVIEVNKSNKHKIIDSRNLKWNWSRGTYKDLRIFQNQTDTIVMRNKTYQKITGVSKNRFFVIKQEYIFFESKTKVLYKFKNLDTKDVLDFNLWYVMGINKNQRPKFRDGVLEINGIYLDFNDLKNKFTIKDKYIGSGEKFGLDKVVALRVKQPSGILKNNQEIILDPTITNFKRPYSCGVTKNQWTSCTNGFTSNDLDTTENTLNQKEDYMDFNLDEGLNPNEQIDSINGIEISIEADTATGCGRFGSGEVMIGTTLTFSNKTSSLSNQKTSIHACGGDTTNVLGGLTDMWGLSGSFTRTNLTNSSFRVRIEYLFDELGNGATPAVDQIMAKVNYSIHYGSSPVINLTYPLNDTSFTGNNSTLINWSIKDVENNTITSVAYGYRNVSYRDYSILDYNASSFSPTFLDYKFNWTVSPIEPENGLEILYHFDNNSLFSEDETIIHDFSGNGNNGTFLLGDAHVMDLEDGILGGSIDLQSSSFVVLKNDTGGSNTVDYNTCKNGCTFSVWAQHDNSSGLRTEFSRRDTASGQNKSFIWMRSDNDTTTFSFSSNGDPSIQCNAFSNHADNKLKWWNYVGVWDNTTEQTKLYINGELVGTTDCAFAVLNEARWNQNVNLRIGTSSTTANIPWLGKIDEFAVWNYTLNSTQIQDLNRLRRETHFWYVNASDGNSTSESSPFQFNLTDTTATDSCSYTSGNWDVSCSDNCVITSDISIDSNSNISLTGSGLFNIQANIHGWNQIYKDNSCTMFIGSGGSLKQ